MKIILIIATVCLWVFSPLTYAALQPAEIAIIAAAGNAESESLAKYYAKTRGIPAANICSVEVPEGEVLDEAVWREQVRPAIRDWLETNDPQAKLCCLVTTWGIPLKIGPAKASTSNQAYLKFLQAEQAHRLGLLQAGITALERLDGEILAAVSAISSAGSTKDNPSLFDAASTGDDKNEDSKDAVGKEGSFEQLRDQLNKTLARVQTRIAQLPQVERVSAQGKLQQLVSVMGGPKIILDALGKQAAASEEKNPQLELEYNTLMARATAFNEAKGLIEQLPPSVERDALLIATTERIGGLLASLEWLNRQLEVLSQNETEASFDSELSLVMWPADYQLLQWQPNYLRAAFDNSQLRQSFRTLMVSRLDGPTLKIAKELIDTAIKVENEGLKGKVYIDARGIGKLDQPQAQKGSFEDFDRSLLITAKGIKEQTNLEVVLDEKPGLFQADQCPESALYCGWYSLAKYIDAFDWQPGAVAYHLASSEAATLHDPKSQVWCKRMLEEGVCATIGPVYEPYLVAFPNPQEFFALLLQGDLTLVECYYRSQPFNSWMMALVGDPLYTPFKTKGIQKPPTGAPR